MARRDEAAAQADGPGASRPPLSAVAKYGPLAAVLAAFALIAVLVTVKDPASETANGTARSTGASTGDPSATDGNEQGVADTDGTSTGAGSTEAGSATDRTATGAPAPTGRMPITWHEAEADGTVGDHDWGERCDLETGTVKLPVLNALPCVPVFDGDNGGATGRGVTADTIRIVRYTSNPQGELTAVLSAQGSDDEPADIMATLQDYLDIFASRAETYGRRIELIEYVGTGDADDVIASRADAREIAEEIDPLLVIESPLLDRGVFAEELAANGIMCFECGTAIPSSVVQDNPGMIWGPLPGTDQFLSTLTAWIGASAEAANSSEASADERAANQNAVFAGDPAYHDRPRKTGVIHFEQDPPLFDDTAATFNDSTVADRQTYIFDFATMPEKAVEIIAKFKAAEITTITFLGDPVMPIYLTQQATAQEYFPEWLFTGTALTDTNIFGRRYDPAQMEHAFGISQISAPVAQDLQPNIRLHRWWFGEPGGLPTADGQYNLIAPRARFVIDGIHMAGPDLDANSFRDGLFRIPPTPSGVTTAQVSWGEWGYFEGVDYSGIDDSVEIWWDPDLEAEDEIGQMGTGVWRRAHGGQRFVGAGDSPAPPGAPFVLEDTVTVLEELPPDEIPPDYPPPANAPAAG